MNWAVDLSRKLAPKSGEASLYGVVVYSSSHGHMSKMLQDAAYWAALDEASGPQWTVFIAAAVPGRYAMQGGGIPGALSAIQMVWKEPAANRELIAAFDLESTENPQLVVFTGTPGGETISAAVKLSDSSVEGAYNSLKGVMKSVADVLDGMLDENRRVDQRAFEIVQLKLWQDRQITLVKGAWDAFKKLWGLLKPS
jgi:hypothetical protein